MARLGLRRRVVFQSVRFVDACASRTLRAKTLYGINYLDSFNGQWAT